MFGELSSPKLNSKCRGQEDVKATFPKFESKERYLPSRRSWECLLPTRRVLTPKKRGRRSKTIERKWGVVEPKAKIPSVVVRRML